MKDTTPPKIAPTRKRSTRPAGKNRLQKEQDAHSRSSILAAACACFDENGYALTTVHQILARSKISRTTFYRHFESKEEIAWIIMGTFSEGMNRYINDLKEANLDEESVLSWLNRYITFLKGNVTVVKLLRTMPEDDKNFGKLFSPIFNNRIVHLFGGEEGEWAQGMEDKEKVVSAQMLMLKFRNFCYYAVSGKLLHESIAIRQMAKEIHTHLAHIKVPAKS